MNYFIDFEFLENGETIMPISFGMANEIGNFLYIEFEFDEQKAHDHHFIREHVLPHLSWPKHSRKSRGSARELISHFVEDEHPIFWAYYADYDWVILCQIFGTMMDLPKHFPKLCMDLQQWWIMLGRPEIKPKDPEDAHNALADARWNLELYKSLLEYQNARAG